MLMIHDPTLPLLVNDPQQYIGRECRRDSFLVVVTTTVHGLLIVLKNQKERSAVIMFSMLL